QIAEHLENPRTIEAVLTRLEHGPRLALCLFALTETTVWPMVGLAHALECLGVEPPATVAALIDVGVLAVVTEPGAERESPGDLSVRLEREPEFLTLHAHPATLTAARTILP